MPRSPRESWTLTSRGLVRAAVMEERFTPAAESAAYFVVAEALRRSAGEVTVAVARADGVVRVEIETDQAIAGPLTGLSDRVGALGGTLTADGARLALELPCGGTVLGRLRRAALETGGGVTADALMEPGPSTIRADTALDRLAERMRKNDLTSLPVTTPEGELLGVVRRDDLGAESGASRST